MKTLYSADAFRGVRAFFVLMADIGMAFDVNLNRATPVLTSLTPCEDDNHAFIAKCDFVSPSLKPVKFNGKLTYTNDGRSLDDWKTGNVKFG